MLIYRIESDNIGPFESKTINSTHKYKCGDKKDMYLSYYVPNNPNHPLYHDYPSYLPDRTERHMHPDADFGTPLGKFMFSRFKTNDNGSKGFDLGDYVFGFANTEHLNIWFSPQELAKFYIQGYEIHIYDVPDDKVVLGSRQVCFRVQDAISNKKCNIVDLESLGIDMKSFYRAFFYLVSDIESGIEEDEEDEEEYEADNYIDAYDSY